MQPPILLAGGTLHDFQITGVSWLCSLHACGLNGILADEMGLGKTVQVIGFLAALAERFHIIGPHLIVVPLGVLRNWKDALQQWCPSASVMVYHGPKYVCCRRFFLESFAANFYPFFASLSPSDHSLLVETLLCAGTNVSLS